MNWMTELRHRRDLSRLRNALPKREPSALSDAELLVCFLRDHDEDAFAGLIARHGPMVWGVCRRVLVDRHDAEDAFQATFWVLARKAGTIRPRDRVGAWLHGVAYRTALKARIFAQRRRREHAPPHLPEPPARAESPHAELWRVLDEELAQIPDAYRGPVVLCDLEGQTRPEAARLLGCPVGTVSSRLSRGRALLARRLARRGITLSTGTLAVTLGDTIVAESPRMSISAHGAILAEGVIKTMIWTKLLKSAALLMLVSTLALGAGWAWRPAAAEPIEPPVEEPIAVVEEPTEEAEEIPSTEATNIVEAYEFNDAYGDEYFTGKRWQVTGTVSRIARVGAPQDPEGYVLAMHQRFPYIQNPRGVVALSFELPLTERATLADVKRDQRVTIEGTCKGPEGQHIPFTDCKIIKIHPLEVPEPEPDIRPDPDFDPNDRVMKINARDFVIPFHIDQTRRGQIASVVLYSSADGGATWEAVTEQRLDAFGRDQIAFIAPSEGLYQFKLQTVFRDGSREPANLAGFGPDLRVRVVWPDGETDQY